MLAAGVLGQDETTVTEVPSTVTEVSSTTTLPVTEVTTNIPITYSTEDPMNVHVDTASTTVVATVTEKLNNTSLDLNTDLPTTSTEVPLTVSEETTSPAVLPMSTPITEQSPEHVHVEEETTTVPSSTTTTTTKKPAPLVIQTTTLLPTTMRHEIHGKPHQAGESSTPRAPPPTPSTPAGVHGIGDLLKIPQIHLPNLERENALIDAIQKLG